MSNVFVEAMRAVENSLLELSGSHKGLSYCIYSNGKKFIVHERRVSSSSVVKHLDADTLLSVEVPLPTLNARKKFLKLVEKESRVDLKEMRIEFRMNNHSDSWHKTIHFPPKSQHQSLIREAESIAIVDICKGVFKVTLGDIVSHRRKIVQKLLDKTILPGELSEILAELSTLEP